MGRINKHGWEALCDAVEAQAMLELDGFSNDIEAQMY